MAEQRSDHWRELCAAAAKEHDPASLSRLVNQIIAELGEQQTQDQRLCAAESTHAANAEAPSTTP